jgi:hypothetical protein
MRGLTEEGADFEEGIPFSALDAEEQPVPRLDGIVRGVISTLDEGRDSKPPKDTSSYKTIEVRKYSVSMVSDKYRYRKSGNILQFITVFHGYCTSHQIMTPIDLSFNAILTIYITQIDLHQKPCVQTFLKECKQGITRCVR